MSRAPHVLVAVSLFATGALLVASLAVVDVLPAWGLLFFYALPSLFVAGWGARELVPAAWRRQATPLRRAWRGSRLGAPTRVPPVALAPAPREDGALGALLAGGAGAWLQRLRSVLALLRSPRARRLLNAVAVLAAAALLALVARELAQRGWPTAPLQPASTAASVAFFLATFALRATGWQRLFRPAERPRSLVLVTSTGAAAVAAVALPSRVDDAITVGLVRRLARRPPSIGTLALSLFVLGLLDMAALTPFAIYAAVSIGHAPAVRITMAAIAGVGVGAAAVAAALPSVRTSARLTRFRLGHWVAHHAPVSRRDTIWSSLLVCASWLTRAAALFLLLHALGLGTSFGVATAYVVAGGGAAALPLGLAGAATQAAAGAAVLAGAGIDTASAVALAATAQALTVGTGGALAAFGALVFRHARRRSRTR